MDSLCKLVSDEGFRTCQLSDLKGRVDVIYVTSSLQIVSVYVCRPGALTNSQLTARLRQHCALLHVLQVLGIVDRRTLTVAWAKQ